MSQISSPETSVPGPGRATVAFADAVELVDVVRNGFLESRTAGVAVVTGPDGQLLASLGPADALIYPRSTLKPFQTIASQRHGAELTGAQIAIACGSHRASRAHRDLAAQILDTAGLSADDLQCPADWPAAQADTVRLVAAELDRADRDGQELDLGSPDVLKTPLAYNCSGKHAGFLAACVASGHDTASYLDPAHPLQREVVAVIEEYCGESIAHLGVDGCGAPAPVTSLAGLARGIGRVAAAPGRRAAGDDVEQHAADVATAMLEHPWAVHGPTSSNTVVMRELGLLAKLGADGVMVMAAPDGTAVAVKALDGGTRAGNLVALALMERFAAEHVDRDRLAEVRQQVAPGILGRGEPVGSVELAAPVRELIGR